MTHTHPHHHVVLPMYGRSTAAPKSARSLRLEPNLGAAPSALRGCGFRLKITQTPPHRHPPLPCSPAFSFHFRLSTLDCKLASLPWTPTPSSSSPSTPLKKKSGASSSPSTPPASPSAASTSTPSTISSARSTSPTPSASASPPSFSP